MQAITLIGPEGDAPAGSPPQRSGVPAATPNSEPIPAALRWSDMLARHARERAFLRNHQNTELRDFLDTCTDDERKRFSSMQIGGV